MTQKKLIINADDFGRNPDNDQAIIDAFKRGIISSTSVLVTYDGFEAAAKELKKYPEFRAGVHLDFSSGRPITPKGKILSLADARGQFKAGDDKLAISNVNSKELEVEFAAQIQKFVASGLQFTHLDNHRPEIYFFPKLFEIVAKLASKHGVPIRSPFDDDFEINQAAIARKYGVNPGILPPIARASRAILDKYEVRTVNRFLILDDSLRSEDKFLDFLRSLKPGTTEVCTHPGSTTEIENEEIGVLTSEKIKGLVGELGIKLVNYSDA